MSSDANGDRVARAPERAYEVSVDVQDGLWLLQDEQADGLAPEPPETGLFTVDGGQVLLVSGQQDADASARLEVWAQQPGPAEGRWDQAQAARVHCSSGRVGACLLYSGPASGPLPLLGPGTYGMDVHYRRDREQTYSAEDFKGAETWLVPLWPEEAEGGLRGNA